MFAQKYACWNDYVTNNASYQQYPYENDGNYTTYTNNGTSISPVGSTCSSNRSCDYLKELLDKISEKEKCMNATQKQLINSMTSRSSYSTVNNLSSCEYNTTTVDDNNNNSDGNNNSSTSSAFLETTRQASILSRFYKPDGTPIKSLWESDSSLKEQRAYKYDPKPLERRKNPRAFVPCDKKTEEYWEKRRKNNMAARKSREDRRRKEIEILKNVETLKSDNLKLKIYAQKVLAENQNLKYEADLLKRI